MFACCSCCRKSSVENLDLRPACLFHWQRRKTLHLFDVGEKNPKSLSVSLSLSLFIGSISDPPARASDWAAQLWVKLSPGATAVLIKVLRLLNEQKAANPFMTFPGHKTFGIPHSGKKSGRRKKTKKDFRFPTVTRCPTSAYLVVPPFLRQDGGETESKLSISLLVKGATPPPQTNKQKRAQSRSELLVTLKCWPRFWRASRKWTLVIC